MHKNNNKQYRGMFLFDIGETGIPYFPIVPFFNRKLLEFYRLKE